MADLRLLRFQPDRPRGALRTLEVFLVLGFLTGCAPLYGPALSGQLVDAETKEPVAGAEIFTHYEISRRIGFEPDTRSVGNRWTTTDAEGRFSFEKEKIDGSFPYYDFRVRSKPYVVLLDRRYGVINLDLPGDDDSWQDLLFRVSPDAGTLLWFERPFRNWRRICLGLETAEACLRACEVSYGDRDLCEKLLKSY